MAKYKPLTWKPRKIAASSERPLRPLTQRFGGMGMTGAHEMVGAAAAATDIELPDLSAYPTAHDKAGRLLQVASSIEHALLIQYLYAGYGFSPPQQLILGVAVEEMSHLMTVQNMLLLIGAAPDLSRQDFGPPSSEATRLFPFDLLLEPISNVSLAKYVIAESPSMSPGGVDPALMARIAALATGLGPGGGAVNRVGVLYALLGAVFGSEQLLQQKAASGDPWYVAVNELAAVAAAEYGGRINVHLPDAAFDPASVAKQGTDDEWDRSPIRAVDEFRVHVAAEREAALEALRDIGLQGEGPSSVAMEDSHFMRFYNLFRTFFGPDGSGTAPPPGVSSIPKGARILIDENSSDPNAISLPKAAAWARLADKRYAVLLACLELYFRGDETQREFLASWTFAEMYALKRMAGLLTGLPRSGAGNPTQVAAAPFTLPQWNSSPPTWGELSGLLQSAAREIQKLRTLSPTAEELQLLVHLESSDPPKIAEANAQQGGGTVRRKFDRVREILDWAAGAGNPRHNGNSPSLPTARQGRFWNLPLNDFKEVEISGTNIVQSIDGQIPLLVEVLTSGFMPRDRSAVVGEKLTFVVDWIENGCPDDPLNLP